MRVYVGKTYSGWMLEECIKQGWGEMTVRGELPPKRHPWALDNGAFRDWRRDRPFQADKWSKCLAKLAGLEQPDFVVAPDVVGRWEESVVASLAGAAEIRASTEAPVYLAIQDGAEPGDIPWDKFDGLFVGGTLPWKLEAAGTFVDAAHDHGVECHIGRVGTKNRVRWARRLGADSIDSCLPLFSRENLERFKAGLRDSRQQDMWT